MSIPTHWLHIYQRPKQGDDFITRLPIHNYRHTLLAVGGDDTANGDLVIKPSQTQNALEGWVGARVSVYVDNPAQPIFEGLISRIMVDVGGVIVSRSLDEMFNRAVVIWTNIGVGTTTTAAHNETDSQAVYGIKHGTIDGFAKRGVATLQMNAIRELVIDQTGWPLTTVTQGALKGNVRVELKGFYHTIVWDDYYNGGAAAINPSTLVQRVVTALTNGTTFVDNSDLTLIDTNAAYTVQEQESFGKTAWQVIESVVGGGDGSNYWVAGVTRTDPVLDTRRVYYRQANSAVEYTTRAADALRVRNVYGGLVRPWTVRPDRAIRIQDILPAWSARGLDPRETYIEKVRYDANKQQVTWANADDLHMQGAFQEQRYYKFNDTLFGNPPRNSWQ